MSAGERGAVLQSEASAGAATKTLRGVECGATPIPDPEGELFQPKCSRKPLHAMPHAAADLRGLVICTWSDGDAGLSLLPTYDALSSLRGILEEARRVSGRAAMIEQRLRDVCSKIEARCLRLSDLQEASDTRERDSDNVSLR